MAPTEVTGEQEIGLREFREITSRQDALTARMDRVDNHLNVIAQDQNNAAESNQALWINLEQCVDQVRRLQDRFHDISSEESKIERILTENQRPCEQNRNRSDQEFKERCIVPLR